MSNPLIVEFDADITKLQAKLAVAEQDLKRATAGVNRSARTGDVDNTAEAIVAREAALAHTAAIGKQIAANELAMRGFNERARESVAHFERAGAAIAGIGSLGGASNLLFGGGLGKAGVGLIAGAAVFEGLKIGWDWLEGAAERAHKVEGLSVATHISTGRLQTWGLAARNAAVDSDLFARAIERFSIGVEKAADKQRELAIDIAKAVADENGVVLQGGRSAKKPPELRSKLIEPPPKQLQLESEELTQETKDVLLKAFNEEVAANTERRRIDPNAPRAPHVDEFFRHELALMNKNDAAGREARDRAVKAGATNIPAFSDKEMLDRQKPGFLDTFTKNKIPTTDLQNQTREIDKVWDEFAAAATKAVNPVKMLRDEIGRMALDPNFVNFALHFKDYLKTAEGQRRTAGLPTEGHDPNTESGGELHKFLTQTTTLMTGVKDAIALGAYRSVKGLGEALTEGTAKAAEFARQLGAVGGADAGIMTDVKAMDALDTTIEKATKDADALGSALSGDESAGAGISTEGHASGGYIRGPGSGTSDSILARLSNGEFVMSADAVSRIGVSALNRMNALGYAGGGIVGFAGGGSVGRGAVHLHIGGDEYPLNGADHVVSALVSAAGAQQSRSAGAKPTWFGR